MNYGVRRLVVINSGKYSYANIDLSKPVHLVAPNNSGKTTLVNCLQFLFIDEVSKMQFGRSLEDTSKHYFGADLSYLIFECLTPSGIQCMLVHGLGNLQGGKFDSKRRNLWIRCCKNQPSRQTPFQGENIRIVAGTFGQRTVGQWRNVPPV